MDNSKVDKILKINYQDPTINGRDQESSYTGDHIWPQYPHPAMVVQEAEGPANWDA